MLNDEEWCKWSDREIAEKCCVSNRFVSNVRPTSVTVNGSQLTERTYTTKHGTIATMNTANICERLTDKHKAVMTLLNDKEWSTWSGKEIAKRCCVDYT